MVLTNFNGAGVGFGFGVGCGFGIGWGFGGNSLQTLGLGVGYWFIGLSGGRDIFPTKVQILNSLHTSCLSCATRKSRMIVARFIVQVSGYFGKINTPTHNFVTEGFFLERYKPPALDCNTPAFFLECCGGCGVGLGLGWGFGAAYGTQYVSSKAKFEGIDYENVKTIHEKDKSKILMKETQNRGE